MRGQGKPPKALNIKTLYQHALIMLEAAQSGLDTVINNKEQLRGELTITLPTALIKAPLTQKLAQFSKHHPMLSLNLEYKDERSNLIEEGVDLAIRAGTMADSNLKSKRIGEIKRLIVCSSAFFKSQPKPIAISDIAHWNWNWISLAMLSNARMLKNNQGEHYKIEYKSNISVNNICAMVEMCEQGVGVATPPD